MGSITWREWDGECVVHLGAHASTHLLDVAAGSVLKALLQARCALPVDDLAALSFGIGTETATAALSVDERAALQAILLELQRIGAAQVDPS